MFPKDLEFSRVGALQKIKALIPSWDGDYLSENFLKSIKTLQKMGNEEVDRFEIVCNLNGISSKDVPGHTVLQMRCHEVGNMDLFEAEQTILVSIIEKNWPELANVLNKNPEAKSWLEFLVRNANHGQEFYFRGCGFYPKAISFLKKRLEVL